jgi:hypothetical protein
MKKSVLLVLGFMLTWMFAFPQEVSKPIYRKAAYFDVSPPLRDMVRNGPGKVDMAWKDGVVKNKFIKQESNVDPRMVDALRQQYNGTTLTDDPILNFDGVAGNGSLCPPDTYGEVGLNHYFQCVNVSYAIYNKSGVKLLGPALNKSIWNGFPGPWQNSNDGDAIVQYDEQADRWLFSQFALPNYPNGPFYEMIAISQTPDPTGSWYRWAFTYTDMPDYPKFGVWGDAYYMSTNRFGSGTGNYKGIGAIAFDRTAMLAGDPNAGTIMFTIAGSSPYRIVPSDCDSDFPPAGTPNYFMYLHSPNKIDVYEFHTDWTTPANSSFAKVGDVVISTFNGNISTGIPQKGTNVLLDDFSGSLMYRLPFRKFSDHWSIVGNATVNVGSGQAGIRWFELRTTSGTWSLYQEGTYSPDTLYRWMGSIAMDSSGNMALGYSVSSHDIYPSIRYTGRVSGDPLGEMTIAESTIIDGGGSQTNTWSGSPSRWGDYSGITVDPAAAATFWYTNEYYQTTSQSQWKTRIAEFSFGDILSVNATATPPQVCVGDSSQLNAIATGGSGTYTYSWTSIPAGFTSNLQNPKVGPVDSTRYVVAVNDGTLTKNDTVDVSVILPPVVNAGPDTTYCTWVSMFPCYGSASGYTSLLWTTTGDGTFNFDTVAVVLYTPGYGDKTTGSVTLVLTAQSQCPTGTSDSVHIIFDPCTGIADPTANVYGMQVKPNPSAGLFTLDLTGLNPGEISVLISDDQGKTVVNRTYNNTSSQFTAHLDMGSYPKGIYFLRVQTGRGVLTDKVIIR